MVKLIYDGAMARGRSTLIGIVVEKGKSYDIPSNHVDTLLKTGEWKRASEVTTSFEKKVKEDKTIVDEDIEENSFTKKKSTNGGNKKW